MPSVLAREVPLNNGGGVMREVRASEFYQRMSVEDQIQFDRWLKANAVVASIFTAAVVAMAFVGGQNSGPADASTAGIRTVSKSELLASDRTNWGKAYRRVHEARQRPMPDGQ
jgi:hypothetical protein